MKNRHSVLIGLVFLVIVTSITTLAFSSLGSILLSGSLLGYSPEDWAFIRKIVTAKNVLEKNFYGKFDEAKVYDGAMDGLLNSLDDPYTSYLSKNQDEELKELTEGKYEGIGVVVAINPENSMLTVVGIIKDSPANKAEILLADEITAINGEKTQGLTLEQSVTKMKIQAGNKLVLTINRSGKEISKEILTEEIILKSVYSENKDGIGYIEISTFAENTSEEFTEKYNELKEQGINGLIIDLRDNGGGIFDEAVEIAQTLVPNGLIVYTENKEGKKEESYSYGKGVDIPMAVLINGESASASEILAGAIKDRKCGTLIGEKTFGKGVVQGWYKISDGTSIKLTIAKYYTPNGTCIDGVGIEPDIKVVNDNYNDLQIKKAIEILKK